MLNINRARGRNRHFVVNTVSGRRLAVNPDGSMTIAKPVFEERKLDSKFTIVIHARTLRELMRMVSSLKKKHPQIDVNEVVTRADLKREYSREPYAISLNVGGPLAGRAMIKSCLAMVYDAGCDIGHCKEAEIFSFER